MLEKFSIHNFQKGMPFMLDPHSFPLYIIMSFFFLLIMCVQYNGTISSVTLAMETRENNIYLNDQIIQLFMSSLFFSIG